MHWKNLANYDYLGAYSLEETPNKSVALTMREIKVELVTSDGGKKENCIVCKFDETVSGKVVVRPMVLNKTNCKTIESIYGPNIEDWVGKPIIIYSTETKFGRDIVPCLRVKKEELKCSQCGKKIDAKTYNASIGKYGAALCSKECLDKHNGVVDSPKEEAKEENKEQANEGEKE